MAFTGIGSSASKIGSSGSGIGSGRSLKAPKVTIGKMPKMKAPKTPKFTPIKASMPKPIKISMPKYSGKGTRARLNTAGEKMLFNTKHS